MESDEPRVAPAMRVTSYTGFGISIVGAVLDFASGYSFLPMATDNMMGNTPSVTSVGLILLGIVVLISGVVILLPRMVGGMRAPGVMMEILGAVMAFVSYWVTGMTPLLSYSMLVVGAAMIANGWLMQRAAGQMRRE